MLSASQIEKIKSLTSLNAGEGLCGKCHGEGLGMCRGQGAASYDDKVFISDETWWQDVINDCARPEVVRFLTRIITSA